MSVIAAVQLCSSPHIEQNLANAESEIAKLSCNQNCLITLPECFALFGGHEKESLEQSEPLGQGPIQSWLSDMAKKYDCWMVGGTLPIRFSDHKFTASSLVMNNHGERVGHYQKIHLFDVTVQDNTGSYHESKYTQAGSSPLVVEDTPFGRLGVAVCYDMRFPALFRAMEELDVLVLSAAFTVKTGRAHWEVLLRARAIESQCYVVAPAQEGTHLNGRQTYGHSMIIDPWGEVIGCLPHGQGIISAKMHKSKVSDIKAAMPLIRHQKFRSSKIE